MCLFIALLLTTHPPGPPPGSPHSAHYLGNAGVLVRSHNAAVVFDPLFRRDFGRYERVPPAIEAALMTGTSPFETLNAVFVSHFHEDHFSPRLMAKLLKKRKQVHLFAPKQAVDALAPQIRRIPEIQGRIHAVRLDYGGKPYAYSHGAIQIEAVRIPHSGWPTRMRSVENIAFRVTFMGGLSVVHLGDATERPEPFARHRSHWRARSLELALPPYWLMNSETGRTILTEELGAARTIGVHVPHTVPDAPSMRESAYQDVELFTSPGEFRVLDPPPTTQDHD
ncbi:MAG: MBL fold metallo-hydrolase [Myxococcota bacterium]